MFCLQSGYVWDGGFNIISSWPKLAREEVLRYREYLTLSTHTCEHTHKWPPTDSTAKQLVTDQTDQMNQMNKNIPTIILVYGKPFDPNMGH